MKTLLTKLVLLCCAILPTYGKSDPKDHIIVINRPASVFEFTSFNGDTIKSEDLKGTVIVLDFWDSRCHPCLASTPDLEKLYQKFKNRPGVRFFCMDGGFRPMEAEAAFVKKKGYDLPFVYDENQKCAKQLGFGGVGFLIIIDKKSIIRIQHLGYDRAEDYVGLLSKHVEEYLAEP
jgi:peroxiredoxin